MPVWNRVTGEEAFRIVHLYVTTGMTMEQLADALGRSHYTVNRCLHKWLGKERVRELKRSRYASSKLGVLNPMFGKFLEKHPNYKGILTCPSAHGYLLVLKPTWYSITVKNKHVFLHHVVACEHMGLDRIPEGYDVHHCDKNKHNNKFDNLVVMTKQAHTSLHWYLRRLEGATTISKESTLKWVEAHCPGGLLKPGDDIV